jgi:hypothetical protein
MYSQQNVKDSGVFSGKSVSMNSFLDLGILTM